MIDETVVAFIDGSIDAVKEYIDEKLTAIVPPRGEKGEPGPAGEIGPRGEKGEPGNHGAAGPQGPAGDKGEPGNHGPAGRDGMDGKNGNDGARGPEGPPGKDADPVDIAKIIETVLSSIPKPKDGLDGRDGMDGNNGRDGEPGPAGEIGPRGEKGEPGNHGAAGLPGIPGLQGAQGKDGRDALQIDILPSVDLARSYPRGTFARWDGGIIRSYRDTIPEQTLEKSGWEVVVAGISVVSIKTADDNRSFIVSTKCTGQDPVENLFSLPVMIYRGIWTPGTYQKGDVATWAGSAWHCQTNEATDQPGTSDQWKMMVKEGRRGKDGPEGKAGPAGPQGPRGPRGPNANDF